MAPRFVEGLDYQLRVNGAIQVKILLTGDTRNQLDVSGRDYISRYAAGDELIVASTTNSESNAARQISWGIVSLSSTLECQVRIVSVSSVLECQVTKNSVFIIFIRMLGKNGVFIICIRMSGKNSVIIIYIRKSG